MRSRAMHEPGQFVIAYWLLPGAPIRDFWRETIRRLASKYDAPPFDPHLTLAVRPDSADEAARRLAKVPGGVVELRALEIGWTSAFTKTLFVRFHSSPLLLHLRSSLGEDEDREFDPHLSLLYKKISEEEQAQLAAELQLPFSSVSFDTIAATRCRLPMATGADVALWETITSRPLVR